MNYPWIQNGAMTHVITTFWGRVMSLTFPTVRRSSNPCYPVALGYNLPSLFEMHHQIFNVHRGPELADRSSGLTAIDRYLTLHEKNKNNRHQCGSL